MSDKWKVILPFCPPRAQLIRIVQEVRRLYPGREIHIHTPPGRFGQLTADLVFSLKLQVANNEELRAQVRELYRARYLFLTVKQIPTDLQREIYAYM